MLRLICALGAFLALVACAGGEQGPLPVEMQERVAYRHDGPPALTLITVINNRTGAGGHSSLMVSGSQRVIFDPAGTFRPDWVTEYGDVLYGLNERAFLTYKRAHARASHHVVTQTVTVSPETAERALQLVQASGSIPSAYCANATSGILQQLPEFRDVRRTFYPVALMEQVAAKPCIVTDRLYEDDAGNVVDAITAMALAE
jgi:hypothetical protein